MTPEERAAARVTAALLWAARRTDALSLGLTLVAAAALLCRCGWAPALLVAVALGVVARYYGARVDLDRRLFADLAAGRLELAELDAVLRSASRATAGVAARAMTDRCRGARRLLALHAVATVVQLAAVVVAALHR